MWDAVSSVDHDYNRWFWGHGFNSDLGIFLTDDKRVFVAYFAMVKYLLFLLCCYSYSYSSNSLRAIYLCRWWNKEWGRFSRAHWWGNAVFAPRERLSLPIAWGRWCFGCHLALCSLCMDSLLRLWLKSCELGFCSVFGEFRDRSWGVQEIRVSQHTPVGAAEAVRLSMHWASWQGTYILGKGW